MNINQELENRCRNMIQLEISGRAGDGAGKTRFGGVPDVPADFAWPLFKTDTFDDPEVKARPLSFLAQFDCEELSQYDTEGLLPKTGLLSFFYEVGSQRWGYDPKDEGCARAYWFEDAGALSPAEFPDALEEDYRFPVIPILAKPELSFPGWEDITVGYEWWKEEHRDFAAEFNEAEVQLGIEEPGICSKLLGWPNIIQNNMTTECELVSRGYYLGGGWKEVPEAERKEAEQMSVEAWRLLFQLDIVEQDDFELMFGDGGRLYFYIRKDDLLAKRFDRIWLILQCC